MIHFTNARLIDRETLPDSPGSLTVADGLVHSINTLAPKSAHVIDCLPLAPGILGRGEPGERHKDSGKFTGQTAARMPA